MPPLRGARQVSSSGGDHSRVNRQGGNAMAARDLDGFRRCGALQAAPDQVISRVCGWIMRQSLFSQPLLWEYSKAAAVCRCRLLIPPVGTLRVFGEQPFGPAAQARTQAGGVGGQRFAVGGKGLA